MPSSRASLIINRILLLLVLWFFAVAIIGFFSSSTAIIFLSALIVALFGSSVASIVRKKREQRLNPKAVQERMLQFYLGGPKFTKEVFVKALSRKSEIVIENDYLINSSLVASFLHLVPKPLDFPTFCSIFSGIPSGCKKLVIITSEGSTQEVKSKIALTEFGIDIKVLSAVDTYKLLLSLHSLPSIVYKPKKTKRKFVSFLKLFVEPKNARRYLLIAALLIVSSFFMPNRLYYIIFGFVCIVLSLICLLRMEV